MSQLYDFAMEVEDPRLADKLVAAIASGRFSNELKREPARRAELEFRVREDIAYWAAYYDQAMRARVERVYRAEHPFFGPAAKPPPPEVMFAIGVAWANGLLGDPRPRREARPA